MLNVFTDDTQIQSDGRTVWVNDSHGYCTGRFSRHGVDVHRSAAQQEMGMSECLDCIHDLEPVPAWDRFKSSMLEHHGVVVGDEHRPEFVTRAMAGPRP
jgi:hypothetical protein